MRKRGDDDMRVEFEKSLLMSGNDYRLTPFLSLHHPTIEEILQINQGCFCERIYWQYVQFLLSDPYSNMVFLDDIGKNFMETSPFDVFMLQWEQPFPTNFVDDALQLFITEKHHFVKSQYADGSFCLAATDNTDCQITREIYEYLCEWVKAINKINDDDQIHPADESARQILIEDMRQELKKRQKKTDTKPTNRIGNLMSAVAFGGNGTITPFNLPKCKLYWIFEAFHVENKKANASHILDGLYHGTLNSKDVNQEELDWTK